MVPRPVVSFRGFLGLTPTKERLVSGHGLRREPLSGFDGSPNYTKSPWRYMAISYTPVMSCQSSRVDE